MLKMRTALSGIIMGIAAGICISLGGSVFLGCDSKYVGAAFFCVALYAICARGYALFTGKVGFIVESHSADEVTVLICCLIGNLIGTLLCGVLIRFGLPPLFERSAEIVASKLTQLPYQTFIRAIFCGILMYIAVIIWRKNNSPLGILLCIPAFILSGFEHSIADMFYFFAAMSFGLKQTVYLLIVVLGNAVGGMLLPALLMLERKIKNEPKS